MSNEQPVPDLVIPDPRSAEGKQMLKLHAEATEATRVLHEHYRSQREAHTAVSVAKQELAAELHRGALSGERDAKTQIRLVRAIEDAVTGADQALHAPIIAAATQRQANCVLALRSHISRNISPLLDELREEAERVTVELAAAREQLHPYLQAHAEIAAKVNALTEAVHNGRMQPPANRFTTPDPRPTCELWAVPADGSMPMPSPEVVAAHDRQVRPENYPAPPAVDAELTEAVA
jgi:hypothetical protein